jgi:hypothetical protein
MNSEIFMVGVSKLFRVILYTSKEKFCALYCFTFVNYLPILHGMNIKLTLIRCSL